ncbi:MAG: hypothetical protein WCK34_08035 [Bacteroidota bacterium]
MFLPVKKTIIPPPDQEFHEIPSVRAKEAGKPHIGKPAKVQSEKQIRHLHRFQCAKEYGREVVADEKRSALYSAVVVRWKKKKKKHIGVYQLAIMDYMHPPDIQGAEFGDLPGSTHGTIIVTAEDIFLPPRVTVSIVLADGSLAESGEAQRHHPWDQYQYVVFHPDLVHTGTTIRVSARDNAGNVTETEFRITE